MGEKGALWPGLPAPCLAPPVTGTQPLLAEGPHLSPKLAVLLSCWGCWLHSSKASSPAQHGHLTPAGIFRASMGTKSGLGPGPETPKTRSLPSAGSPSSPGVLWQRSRDRKGQCRHR